MASKQVKLQQRNKQPQATSKLLALPKQEHATDPWSFLECIDAPQWVDLSLEASLMGKEGLDSWFDTSHKHHAISLAGLNANMSWLRLGKSSQPVFSKNTGKGCQKVVTKSEKKHTVGHLHLNKSDYGQCWSHSQVKDSGVQKGAQYSDCKDRASNDLLPLNSLNGSVDTGCTFSGSSSTSECEPKRSFKNRSLCSDRSSINSSLQACSVESKKFLVNVRRGSSNLSQSEDSNDTPTCYIGSGRRDRNSSSASYCPPVPKSGYSSEVGVSTSTKSRGSSELGVSTSTQSRYSSELGVSTSTQSRYSSELGVSTCIKWQSGCHADCQSSGDSVVTFTSGVSWTAEEQVSNGCARIQEEAIDDIGKVGELEDDVDCYQPLCRGFTADSRTVDKSLLQCQQMAKGVVNCGIKAGRRRLETRVSQVGSSLRKQPSAGKENAPPKGNLTAANLLQVNEKLFHTKTPLAVASSKMANAKYNTIGVSVGGASRAPQISKKEGHGCAAQVVLSKSRIAQGLNGGRTSAVAPQRNRTEATQVPASGFASNSVRDLAALVAQHNQKIETLGLQNRRKGLR
eukprot:c15212_g1_i1 orf=328-2037(-)